MKARSVIDLFCGIGGMTHGFVLENFEVLAGVDSDPSCRYPYEHNNRATFINKSVEDLTAEELSALYPEGHTRILVGCAPCQMYSKYTNRYASQKPKDPEDKWKLLAAFADLIDVIQPEVVSMENVPELVKFDGGRIYRNFVERLGPNYRIKEHLVYCPDYGIPQSRTRLVFFASKFGPLEIIPKSHKPGRYRSVRDVIGDLPQLTAGQVDTADSLHRTAGMSELNLLRIRQSIPGGTWRDWDPSLLAECHKKSSGKSYASVYGRMKWDEPSPTITTECYAYGSGRFGHPEQDRAISLREAALLQTFPASYVFAAPDERWSFDAMGRHIGNAVPVDLGRVVAKSIAQHLDLHATKM
jgi:DNA (cytosine-5)-methyltransferase 1